MSYRMKPQVIEAFRLGYEEAPDWYTGNPTYKNNGAEVYEQILTPDGIVRVDLGDYIIKDIDGELYKLDSDTFKLKYEKVV